MALPEGIDGLNGIFIAVFGDADQQVELAGPLVDRADLDPFLGELFEDPHVCVAGLRGFFARHGDQREVVPQADEVGIQGFPDFVKKVVLAGGKKIRADDERDGIDAGQAVFKGEGSLLKDIEHQGAETGTVADHDFFDLDQGHSLSAGDAGHGIFGDAFGKMANDHGTRIFGLIGIAYVDRNLQFGSGENGVGVENGSTHIGEGAKFPVTHVGDSFR